MAGFELHWPRDATEWTAWATMALAAATFVFVLESRWQTGELREARFAEVLPMLRWQEPAAALVQEDKFVFRVWAFLTNEGLGPARILAASATSNSDSEHIEIWDLDIPSTLPAGKRIKLQVESDPADSPRLGHRLITIRIHYGDLLGEFQYETVTTIDVDIRVTKTDSHGVPSDGSVATFGDSDERSALARRIRRSRRRRTTK